MYEAARYIPPLAEYIGVSQAQLLFGIGALAVTLEVALWALVLLAIKALGKTK